MDITLANVRKGMYDISYQRVPAYCDVSGSTNIVYCAVHCSSGRTAYKKITQLAAKSNRLRSSVAHSGEVPRNSGNLFIVFAFIFVLVC